MMLPTHALVGMAIALPVALSVPELAPAALLGGFLGGVLPDLDLYAGHRKTLHYPTLYPIAAVPAAIFALIQPTAIAVAIATLLVAAAVHCRMDIYGGGLELEPWEGTSERAVYDHVRGAWVQPRRFISYDGSKGDLAISAGVGIPLFFVLGEPFAYLVIIALAIAVVYVLLRRRLAKLAPTVFGYVPEPLDAYVPERYRRTALETDIR